MPDLFSVFESLLKALDSRRDTLEDGDDPANPTVMEAKYMFSAANTVRKICYF